MGRNCDKGEIPYINFVRINSTKNNNNNNYGVDECGGEDKKEEEN